MPLCVVDKRTYYLGGLRRNREDEPLAVGHAFRCKDGAVGGLGQITALWTYNGNVFIEYQCFVERKMLKHMTRPYWGTQAVVGVAGRVFVAHPEEVIGDSGAWCAQSRRACTISRIRLQ